MKKVLHKIFFSLLNLILFYSSLWAMEQFPLDKPFTIKINENVKVFLGEVNNQTKKNIKITSTLLARTKIFENIAHGEKELLNKEIELELTAKNEDMFRVDFIINSSDRYPYLKLMILYDKKQIKVQYTFFKAENALPSAIRDLYVIDLRKIDQGQNVYVDLLIAGENFENSRITSHMEAKPVLSLKEQSLKRVVEEIKAKKITLLQAKKTLPAELYQELLKYLKESK